MFLSWLNSSLGARWGSGLSLQYLYRERNLKNREREGGRRSQRERGKTPPTKLLGLGLAAAWIISFPEEWSRVSLGCIKHHLTGPGECRKALSLLHNRCRLLKTRSSQNILTPLAPTPVSHTQTFTSFLESFLWGWRKPRAFQNNHPGLLNCRGKKDREAWKSFFDVFLASAHSVGRRMFGWASVSFSLASCLSPPLFKSLLLNHPFLPSGQLGLLHPCPPSPFPLPSSPSHFLSL